MFIPTKNFKVKKSFCFRTFKIALNLFWVQIDSNYHRPRGISKFLSCLLRNRDKRFFDFKVLSLITLIAFHSSIPIQELCRSMMSITSRESLGYAALMGAPPKVQPMFESSTYRITGLHCTHRCATLSTAYTFVSYT